MRISDWSSDVCSSDLTFAAVPGLVRPLNTTPWATLALAGDWTDTGYPGVLEGAVRSGLQAARVLLARQGRYQEGPARRRPAKRLRPGKAPRRQPHRSQQAAHTRRPPCGGRVCADL